MIKFYFGFDIIIFAFSSCEPEKQNLLFWLFLYYFIGTADFAFGGFWFSICSKFCGVKFFVKRIYRVTVESRSLLVAWLNYPYRRIDSNVSCFTKLFDTNSGAKQTRKGSTN